MAVDQGSLADHATAGSRWWHEEFGLLIIEGEEEDPAMVKAKQFQRNGRLVVVPRASLTQLPEASTACWFYPQLSRSLYRAVRIESGTKGLTRFPPNVEASLEAAYLGGARRCSYQMRDEYSGSLQDCVLDFVEMTETNLEARYTRMVKRVEKSEHSAEALTVVELEELIRSGGGRAQLRQKGPCKALFMMENNVKVIVDKTKKNVFVSLEDLFAPGVDIEAHEAIECRRFDSSHMSRFELPREATDPLSHLSVPFTIPLNLEMAAQYVADDVEVDWQYKTGSAWSSFPASIAKTLAETINVGLLKDNGPIMALHHISSNGSADESADLGVRICNGFLTRDRDENILNIVSSEIDRSRFSEMHDGKETRADDTDQLNIDEILCCEEAAICHLHKITEIVVDPTDSPLEEATARNLDSVIDKFVKCFQDRLGIQLSLSHVRGTGSSRGRKLLLRLSAEVLKICEYEKVSLEDLSVSHIGRGFAIQAPVDDAVPVIISSPTINGLMRGCTALLRAAGIDSSGKISVPSVYVADVPLVSGENRRVAVAATTSVQSMSQFFEFAIAARRYRPSSSRIIRRVTRHHLMHPVHCDSALLAGGGRYVHDRTYGLVTLVSIDGSGEVVIDRSSTAGYDQIERGGAMPAGDLISRNLCEVFQSPTCRRTGIDWSTASFAEEVPGGQSSVILIELKGNGRNTEHRGPEAVVLKRTSHPGSELAAFLIGKALQVNMPAVTILGTRYNEGRALLRKLTDLILEGKLKSTSKGSRKERAPFWNVQEYVKGHTLRDICFSADGMGHKWAEETFGCEGSLSMVGRRRLFKIGKIIAFDILIHNNDRFYLQGIFSNLSKCGNVANIMFDFKGEPVAIDNSCNAYDILESEAGCDQFENYICSVQKLVVQTNARLFPERQSYPVDAALTAAPHPALAGFRQLLMHGQGLPEKPSYLPGIKFDIGEEGTHAIERGFISVCDTLSANLDLPGMFNKIEASVLQELMWQTYSDDMWSFSLDFTPGSAHFFKRIARAMMHRGTSDKVPKKT